VDVFDGDFQFLAGFDGLGFQILDGLVVVVAPLLATPVTVVLAPHAFDTLGETGALVGEWTVGHGIS
jgi:hypothetical protein